MQLAAAAAKERSGGKHVNSPHQLLAEGTVSERASRGSLMHQAEGKAKPGCSC